MQQRHECLILRAAAGTTPSEKCQARLAVAWSTWPIVAIGNTSMPVIDSDNSDNSEGL